MFHPYNRLKEISRALKVPLGKIEKKLVVRRRKKFFCKFDGVWFAFKSTKAIIVPFDAARLLAAKHNRAARMLPLLEKGTSPDQLNRIPVVAVLGHFNHGKTTLLDNLAGTDFVSIEKHGITQIIRTRTVGLNGRAVTVVDTPGQDIFFRMRNYGASVADVVVLVVALDDGICPQTEESIGVAESLGCPVLVCINKTDLPTLAVGLEARIATLVSELRKYDILERACIVPMSALTGSGVEHFKETLWGLVSALPASGVGRCDHDNAEPETADPDPDPDAVEAPLAARHGTVINSWTSQREGVMLHVVVREGAIKVKDWFTCGGWAGYIGAIEIDDERAVDGAGPGSAVKLRVHVKHQFDPLPLAETILFVDKEAAWHQAEQRAMEYSLSSYAVPPEDTETFRLQFYARHTLQFQEERRLLGLGLGPGLSEQEDAIFVDDDGSNDTYEEDAAESSIDGLGGEEESGPEDPRRRVVLKADTAVSLGTMYDALTELSGGDGENEGNTGNSADSEEHGEAFVRSRRVVSGSVGIVSPTDVMMAGAADAPILIYGVGVDAKARRLAQSQHVPIYSFDKMQDVIDILLGAELPQGPAAAKRTDSR